MWSCLPGIQLDLTMATEEWSVILNYNTICHTMEDVHKNTGKLQNEGRQMLPCDVVGSWRYTPVLSRPPKRH